MSLRLDGYVRVSRVGGREGEGYISPGVQRDAIGAYARELGGTIVAWHDDQDFSGGNVERPGFQAMLERLEGDEIDGIVVMRIDRFARSTADGSKIVREIVDRGQIFASCHERIDPRTGEGRYMLRSFLSNAELFLDQITASWETSKARAIARGVHIGPTPTGYLKVEAMPSKPTHVSPVDSAALGGPTAPGKLVPSPVYGPALTRLFRRAATGEYGDTALARWMAKEAPRAGGAPWSATEVRRWLRNRIYLGEVRYGKLVNDQAHTALTDPETWEQCQREAGDRRVAPSPFLLRGLLRCASCRYTMGGMNHGGRNHTPVYRCPRSRYGCPGPAVITATRIEDYLLSEIGEQLRGAELEKLYGNVQDVADVGAYETAVEEVKTFIGDIEARRLLGETAWQEGMQVRVADREAKLPAREAALGRMRKRELTRRSVEDLDRHGLRDLLTGMVRYVFIRRGRGMSVAERSLVIWSDDVRHVEVPGYHNRLTFEPVRW